MVMIAQISSLCTFLTLQTEVRGRPGESQTKVTEECSSSYIEVKSESCISDPIYFLPLRFILLEIKLIAKKNIDIDTYLFTPKGTFSSGLHTTN